MNTTHAQRTAAADGQPTVLTPAEIVGQLRSLREQMVSQTPKTPRLSRGQRRRLAHLNDEFVLSAVNSAGVSEALQKAIGRNDTDLRGEMAEIALWSAIADELRGILSDVLDGILVRRARLGLATVQIQKISRELVRDPDQHGQLEANIAEMKRLNPFQRKRKAADPATVPAPAPAHPPVAKS